MECLGTLIVPITPLPVLSSDWYSLSFFEAESSPLAWDPPWSAENGSTASPKMGWPDSASFLLYARAAVSLSSAYG